MRRLATILILVAGLLAACGPGDQAATGVVIAVRSEGASVTGFTLRTDDGRTMVFRVGELETGGSTFAAAHLAEHAATLAPIAVGYRVKSGENVVHRLADAPGTGWTP